MQVSWRACALSLSLYRDRSFAGDWKQARKSASGLRARVPSPYALRASPHLPPAKQTRGKSEDLHSLITFILTRANRSPSAHVVLQAVTCSSAFIESTRFSSAAQAQTCWPLASHVCVLERASEITIAEHQAVQHVGDLRANTHAKKAMCGGARRRCSANCRHSCCRRRSGLARCRLARGRAERGKACAPND